MVFQGINDGISSVNIYSDSLHVPKGTEYVYSIAKKPKSNCQRQYTAD